MLDHDPPLISRFHQIDLPGRRHGICWQAWLCFHGDNPPHPIAMAWLSDYRVPTRPGAGMGMVLDFILVPDQYRRRGYARALIDRCRARWPDLVLTDGISPEGEALLASLE